jgi:broad specificity phosphatase PhoE
VEASSKRSPTVPHPFPGVWTTLWLIRHAEVEERYQNVFGGRIDMDLSPLGHEQAAALAAYLQHRTFDAVYASPMKRVQQTLAACQANGLPEPVVLPALREVDFGAWTGMSWVDVERKHGIHPIRWLEQLECGGIAEAECAASLRARLEPCVKELLPRHAGQQVALFCHGGVIRMLLTILLGWPLTQFASVEIDYASLTRVAWNPDRCLVHLLNFAPWRDHHV